jgi:UrcA family protein
MNTKFPALRTNTGICVAVLAACVGLSPPLQAKEHIVTVQVPVAAADLNLSQPADARELYGRLSHAARTVCGDSLRVDARPLTDFANCYELALGAAVRAADRPQLTLVYMRTHTLQDAANRGISVPILTVSK